MTSIRYNVVRRDSRGLVRIAVEDEFDIATQRVEELRRLAKSRGVSHPADFFVSLLVEETDRA